MSPSARRLAPAGFQNKLARFLENHDEPRAAATFAPGMHEAAGVMTFLSPGLRFFHEGQFEGRRKRISPHLVRACDAVHVQTRPTRFTRGHGAAVNAAWPAAQNRAAGHW